MTTNDASLQPCPFCGNSSILVYEDKHYEDFQIYCATCGGEGGCAPSVEEAIALWNMRPEPSRGIMRGIPTSVLKGEDDEGT